MIHRKLSINDSAKLPVVSICIPLYNAEQYIGDTLERVSKQTYPNIEIIIVDDHSTDNSLSIAKEFESEKIHLFSNPKKGGSSARNYAFERSKGTYIKFMDADDFCSDAMIENQLNRLLEDGTRESLVFSPVRMLQPNGQIFKPKRSIDKDYSPGIELLIAIWNLGGFNCPHCHLMHRDLVARSGGWNETIIKNQDGEFFARIAASADKALSVPEEFAIWRQTTKGVSVQASLEAHASVIDSYRIITHLLLSYNNTEENKDICAKYIGGFVYTRYPKIKKLLPKIMHLLSEFQRPLMLPERKVLKVLRFFLGWKIALLVINKFKL